MKVADLIREQISFIERGWTQVAMARDEHGCVVGSWDRDKACSWCWMGALYAALGWPTPGGNDWRTAAIEQVIGVTSQAVAQFKQEHWKPVEMVLSEGAEEELVGL